MKSLMISVSGVRGIVGDGLTPDIIARYATAFGSFSGGGKIVVGRDARTTGPMLEHAVFSGLMAAGCSVINIGLSATPTIQLAVEKYGAAGGIAITASHNPQEWNAVKFMDRNGIFLDVNDGMHVLEAAESLQAGYVDHSRVGSVEQAGSFNAGHIKQILCCDSVKPDVIRRQNFKVVVDCINSAGSFILPELLLELGCDVVRLNCDANGAFTRGAEPLPENLGGLCEIVRESGAAVGFACDPDADRLAVVSNEGVPLGEEYTLVIAVKEIMRTRSGGSVAANVSTTAALDDLGREYGFNVVRSRVGEVHVVNAMKAAKAVIGGEGNGGVIFPEIHYGRDAMVGAALILQHIAEEGRPVADIFRDLPQYSITKRKVPLDPAALKGALSSIEAKATGAKIDKTDGLKLLFPQHWVHLRKSNTEPIVRVIAEAKTKDEADSVAEYYVKLLQQSGNTTS